MPATLGWHTGELASNGTGHERFLLDLPQVTPNGIDATRIDSAFTGFLSLSYRRRGANPRRSSHLLGMIIVI